MRIFFITILLCISTILSAQTKEWKTHKSDSCYIQFKVPNTLVVSRKDLNGIVSTLMETKDLTCLYSITASKFKGYNFSKGNNNDYYQELKKGSLIDHSSILIDEHSLAYKKMLSKEIHFSLIINKAEYIYYRRFFFRDNFIYQITIGGMRRHLTDIEANKERFFNSIDFL